MLQLADSALPAGGFAHSGGLEAAWQLGEIPDRQSLAPFLESSLRQAATASLPLVIVAHREPDRLHELDTLCDVWTSNHVANRASRLQGRAFWTALTHAFLPDAPPPPHPGHFAPAFGVLLRSLGLSAESTGHLFLFQHLRGLVSASVRLGIIGPLEAQGVQFRLADLTSSLVATAPALSLDDLAQSAPLLDVFQGAHDRLYSRLFQS
ncbi:MAG: urease accessory protein UreF [Limisphaerales bacterium]